jgi:hypothetical protein
MSTRLKPLNLCDQLFCLLARDYDLAHGNASHAAPGEILLDLRDC